MFTGPSGVKAEPFRPLRVGATQSNRSTPRSTAATRSSGNPTPIRDRKSTRLNSSHSQISYAVFCLKKNKEKRTEHLGPIEATLDPQMLGRPSLVKANGNAARVRNEL